MSSVFLFRNRSESSFFQFNHHLLSPAQHIMLHHVAIRYQLPQLAFSVYRYRQGVSASLEAWIHANKSRSKIVPNHVVYDFTMLNMRHDNISNNPCFYLDHDDKRHVKDGDHETFITPLKCLNMLMDSINRTSTFARDINSEKSDLINHSLRPSNNTNSDQLSFESLAAFLYLNRLNGTALMSYWRSLINIDIYTSSPLSSLSPQHHEIHTITPVTGLSAFTLSLYCLGTCILY